MFPTFLTMFLLLGVLLIALSIPLIQGKVAPNPWYGFRVPRTLRDSSVWYPANEYAARRLLRVGIVTLLVAVAAYFVPNIELPVYATIVATVVVIGLVITLVQSFVYLSTLAGEETANRSD